MALGKLFAKIYSPLPQLVVAVIEVVVELEVVAVVVIVVDMAEVVGVGVVVAVVVAVVVVVVEVVAVAFFAFVVVVVVVEVCTSKLAWHSFPHFLPVIPYRVSLLVTLIPAYYWGHPSYCIMITR